MTTRVYVLEMGEYDDSRVEGVFATLGAAQSAGGGKWKQQEGFWSNNRRWNKAGVITEWEVEGKPTDTQEPGPGSP